MCTAAVWYFGVDQRRRGWDNTETGCALLLCGTVVWTRGWDNTETGCALLLFGTVVWFRGGEGRVPQHWTVILHYFHVTSVGIVAICSIQCVVGGDLMVQN